MMLEEGLEHILAHCFRDLHTALPGRVESYDASKQTCDVLPMIKRQIPDGSGGYKIEDLPVLPNVPVAFPRGGGGFFMSFPLQKGDFVMLVFCERAIGAWRKKGEATSPGDLRTHSLAGAVAYPGLYPSDGKLEDAHAQNMVLGKDGSTAQIHLKTDGSVHLGGENGAEFVALATKVQNQLNALKTAINGAVVVANDGGASLKSTLMTALASWPASVAASKVKAT
jgi:hypothetical protein